MENSMKNKLEKTSQNEETMNIIVSGYGGQGVLTLSEMITKAALSSDLTVRQAELHGLAQRGGALRSHIRIGGQVNSPLVMRGDSDLIISLDLLEGLRSCYWANKRKTTMLVNNQIFWPYEKSSPEQKETEKRINELVKKLKVLPGTQTVEDLTGETISLNVYFFAQAIKEDLLPFNKEAALQSLKDKLGGKEELFTQNKKVFDKAFE